jgi:DegV family protein with EDD domain
MRRSFAVVTDSTSDMTQAQAAEHDITVIPLSVTIAGETYVDQTLSQAEFFARMNSAPALPSTSQPSLGAFVTAFEAALEKADEVIAIHVSSQLSGTYEGACRAAEQFGGRVHVFDSLNLSWGLAWQVLDAARSCAEGLDVTAALARLDAARERCRLVVGLDRLDNLAKGGRIGRVGAFLGSVLDLRVTLTVARDGSFTPLGRDRGEKAALRRTLEWVTASMGDVKAGRFAVGHALSAERAQWLAEQINERFDATELVIYEAGSVICTHTGTGWGIAVMPEATPG